jgi:hypothetical protein
MGNGFADTGPSGITLFPISQVCDGQVEGN